MACATQFEQSTGTDAAKTKCAAGETVGTDCAAATCDATTDKAACCVGASSAVHLWAATISMTPCV